MDFDNTCVILVHPWSLKNINIESYFFGIKKNKFYNLHIKKLIIPFLNSINNLIPIIISLPSGFLPHSSVGEITHEIFYDEMGYRKLKKSLKLRGIFNVLLMGYSLDECVISTSAGYLNLKKDFNTFLFSDMTLSNFPLEENPMNKTTLDIKKASTKSNLFITNAKLIEVKTF